MVYLNLFLFVELMVLINVRMLALYEFSDGFDYISVYRHNISSIYAHHGCEFSDGTVIF